jgi:hypothetical protein
MAERHSSPWAEFSEQRRASARKYKALRNELGMAFKEAQQDAYEQWAEWDETLRAETNEQEVMETSDAPVELPLAAAPPERERTIVDLEDIRLNLSWEEGEIMFDGYIAILSDRDIVVYFTEISGEDDQSGHTVVQFFIPERQLFSEPFSIRFLRANLGRYCSLGVIPEHEVLNLQEMSGSLRVQLAEGTNNNDSDPRKD